MAGGKSFPLERLISSTEISDSSNFLQQAAVTAMLYLNSFSTFEGAQLV
jgi:hypothetical protein